jgi:hypothetical protein
MRSVLETLSGPATVSGAFTVDDDWVMKPPVSVVRLWIERVEEMVVAPVTERVLPILDDAFEINPPLCVVRPDVNTLPEASILNFSDPLTARPRSVELILGVELGLMTTRPPRTVFDWELPVKLKLPKRSEIGIYVVPDVVVGVMPMRYSALMAYPTEVIRLRGDNT